MRNFRVTAVAICICFAPFMLTGCANPASDAAPNEVKEDGSVAVTEARVFNVPGMVCDGCVAVITDTVQELPGVQQVNVSLATKQTSIVADEAKCPSDTIIAAIIEAGYECSLAAEAPAEVAAEVAEHSHAQHARADAATSYGVVLNITSGKNDLHAVSMALALGIHSLEHGHKTVAFLNVHAPELAAKALGEDVKYADFPPIKQMLTTFMEKGGTLYACEHCTAVCGVSTEELLDGIVVTKHGRLLAELNGEALVFSY